MRLMLSFQCKTQSLQLSCQKSTKRNKKLENDDPELIEKEFKEKIVVLSICYRNLAVEYEFLKDYELSLDAYKRAKDTAYLYLGKEDQFSIKMNETFNKVSKQLKQLIFKRKDKDNKKEYIRQTISKDPKERKIMNRKASASCFNRSKFILKGAGGTQKRPGTRA